MYMSSNAIDVKVTGAVGTIVLNRPDARNALTRSMLAQLAEAFSDLHLEKRVRAIILTGAGSAFCAGMDLQEMHATATLPDAEKNQDLGDNAESYRELVTQMIELPKPIIASVNGPAVAGGAVWSSPATSSSPPPPPNSASPNPAAASSPASSPRSWPSASAAAPPPDSCSHHRPIPAEEALRLNIYHELIDEPRLWARCAQLGEECAAGAPEAAATHQTPALRNHRRTTTHATHRRRRDERHRPHHRSRPRRPHSVR